MDESINIANKKQILQKPPLSVGRLAGEILVGAVTGFAVAYPVLYLIGACSPEGCFAGFVALGYMLFAGMDLALQPVFISLAL